MVVFKEKKSPRIISFTSLALLATLTIVTISGLYLFKTANAADTSNFDAGNIISDSVFYNSGTMTVQTIQSFLDSKVSSCNTGASYTSSTTGTTYVTKKCLKDYYENPDSTYTVSFSYKDTSGNIQNSSRTYYYNNAYQYTALTAVYPDGDGTYSTSGDYTKGYLLKAAFSYPTSNPSGSISAAQMIYNVAQEYGINPQVLIVLLQKEQGLVTDTWPSSWQFQSATGYGCPDYQACSTGYAGFSKQLYSAAWQFKAYQANPSNYSYVAGKYNTIQWSPTSSCGTSSVYIQNQATAGLYNYTPYRPNQAALDAGYGNGDSCSSYGNRNFWLYFTDWFGSTKTSPKTTLYIPNGYYSLTNTSSGKSIDVTGGGTVNGTAVQIYASNGTSAQKWYISRDSNGYYTLKNVGSGKYLDVTNGSLSSGVKLQIWDGNNTDAQKWAITYSSSGVSLLNKATGYAIDISNGNMSNGTRLQTWDYNGTVAQLWQLNSIDAATMPSGLYNISTSSGLDLDITDGNTDNGAAIQIYTANNTNAQKWQITRLSNGMYTIKNPASGKYLDVSNASTDSGAAIQLYEKTSSCAQQWAITGNADTGLTIQSSCSINVLDVTGGATSTSGTPVQAYTNNGTDAQKWYVNSVNNIASGKTYNISTNSGLALDVTNGSIVSGARAQVWTNNSTSAQTWLVTRLASGLYTIENPVSGKYLDVNGAVMTNTTPIQIWAGNSTCAQEWKIISSSDTTYSIISGCSNSFAIDVAGGLISSSGTKVQLYSQNYTNAQNWVFNSI